MDFNELKNQYIEVENLRTEKSKTFNKGGGKHILATSIASIHYEDDNKILQDIDLSIENNKLEKNVYKAELLTDVIGYSIVSRKDNSRIDVKLDKIGDDTILYSTPIIDGNKAIWNDIITDIDFIIEFRSQRVRCWRRLKTSEVSKDISFNVIEDDGDKELEMVEQIVGYDNDKNPTYSEKVVGEKTLYQTEITKKQVKDYNITETFKDKVIKKDEKTRVKELSDDVQYPVMIDADVQIKVGTSADDGFDSNTVGLKNDQSFLYARNQDGFRREVFTRFDGITIPQSATIDDATLKVHYMLFVSDRSFKIYAFDENDPDAPTTTGDIINKTTGIASNVNTTTHPYAAAFTLQNIDIKSTVQELVNSYDYDNEAMLFFIRKPESAEFDALYIYAYDYGTTKCPELVINYTVAPSGWVGTFNGIPSTSIAKINGIPIANISKVNGIASS